MDKRWEVLAGSALFHAVPATALPEVLAFLQPAIISYAKGAYVATAGEPVASLGVLLTGQAQVIKETVAGDRVIMATLAAGDLFGEMAAFSRQGYWPATVVAQSDCTVAFLPPDRLLEGCAVNGQAGMQLLQNLLLIISERALLLHRKVEYLSMKSLRARIAAYLLEQQRHSGKLTFSLPHNRSELADFLQVSRTALSRELGRMRDEGLLEFYRSSVKLKNLAGLRNH
ncbi:Crp/Fnr family transcriptional regulator [Propionispora hippei]|uniref:cAMP-binding domain of CRP or a regulatory subunit of cAMP-dependent protein kinases n=1 Tax=Propionispora hippei DSM 15287 TaxID=1123003 RepID=A0A1M6J6S5_9FIRM|nr:Crp/Fnr family transcriptional regulator [Propionispora hippei]SHJ42379.1 cAMP-binding domain of CRP or a regulatory subunit of cAMP-dependent protein kinases [Propionispora hippei DSM 15287]